MTTLKKIAIWYPICLHVQSYAFCSCFYLSPVLPSRKRQQSLLKLCVIWDLSEALKEVRIQGWKSSILVINNTGGKKMCWRKMTTPVLAFQVLETKLRCWASGIKGRDCICLLQVDAASSRTPEPAWKHGGEERGNNLYRKKISQIIFIIQTKDDMYKAICVIFIPH